MKFSFAIQLAAVGAVAGAILCSADAHACGMFVPRNLEESIPTISQEQVLIVYDKTQQLEHFVREVNFDAGDGEFGFIVPTPKQPEVAAAKSPFKALRKAYPFEPPRQFEGGPPGSRGMKGAASGGAPPPVQILSVQRVGKFTAFVIAATDAGALGKWLSDNKFQVPPKSKAWLDHYVALGFFYVAFRYDPPKSKKSGLTSETVRISFKTPYPYYPYQEPAGARSASSRLLSLWFVSQAKMKPIAAKSRLVTQHYRPWISGLAYDVNSRKLAGKLGKLSKLLPAGDKLSLQTFRDLKTSRADWGDVLMVPSKAEKLSAQQIAERRWLFPVLDPSLLPQPGEKR